MNTAPLLRFARRLAHLTFHHVLSPLGPPLRNFAIRFGPPLLVVTAIGALAYRQGRVDAYADIAAARATALAPAELSASSAEIGNHRVNIAWLPETVEPWIPLIEEASEKHGVAADLIAIVLLVESGGNPAAMSPSGAVGLMQVMPPTGEYIAGARKIKDYTLAAPETNIDFGAWYLAEQLRAFGLPTDGPDWHESVDRAAVAYNAGPGHIKAHLDTGRALYNEAARYQDWVGGMWRERAVDESDTYERWWEAGGRRLVEAAQVTQDVLPELPDLRIAARGRR